MSQIFDSNFAALVEAIKDPCHPEADGLPIPPFVT